MEPIVRFSEAPILTLVWPAENFCAILERIPSPRNHILSLTQKSGGIPGAGSGLAILDLERQGGRVEGVLL